MTKVLFLRRGFGISQSYLAKILGISRPTLAKKEKGEADFNKSEIEIITPLFQKYNPNLTKDEIFFENSINKIN